MKNLLIATMMALISCTKDELAKPDPPAKLDGCRRVLIYADSLYAGTVVSSYLGYDEIVCGEDLNGFPEGSWYWCDSFHKRTIVWIDTEINN